MPDLPTRRERFSVASGFAHPQFAPVERYFSKLFGSPRGGGGALMVRWRGETVIDLCAGFADPAGARPWTRDTMAIGFSATKGAASTVIHRLADRGLIDYDAPVADYWPQFAVNGKAAITVRDVLSHRAGLYSVRAIARRAEDLLDHLAMEDRLARAVPEPPPRPPAYHALTYGWLLSGLARQITGAGMAELIRTELDIPGMHLGAPPGGSADFAQLIGSHPQLVAAGSTLAPIIRRSTRFRRFSEALAVPGFFGLTMGSQPRILSTEMPSAGGVFTADALATLYAALANEGEVDGTRLLSAATVDQLGQVQTRAVDRVLGRRTNWRLGYHRAVSDGPESPTAFGHYGYGGPGGWADPATGLSLGFVTNKIGMRTTPIGDKRLFRLTGLTFDAAQSG